jgi:hypothetical protein
MALSVPARFPNVEVLLCQALAGFGSTVTETPSDLQAALAGGFVIRVARIGGPDDRISDLARVDVEVFALQAAGSYLAVGDCAEDIRQFLTDRPIRVAVPDDPLVPDVTTTYVIDRVTTTTGPRDIPWADPNVRRLTATYLVRVRR